MNLNELIAECELLDKEATRGPWMDDHVGTIVAISVNGCPAVPRTYPDSHFIARSRTLLPLLVKVIKNQQRQIGLASNALYRLTDFHGNQRANEAITAMKDVAAELEDIK